MKILFSLILTFSSFSAFSATDTGDLILSGTVPEVTTIVIEADGNATALDILNGESGTSVGSASEESNSLGGYKITMHSLHNGFLENQSNSSLKTSYQLNYGGLGFLTPGTSGSPADVVTVSGTGSKITNTRAITINVTALPSAGVGTYSDTVTFTIEGL